MDVKEAETEVIKTLGRTSLVKRMAMPEEVANLVVYLCREDDHVGLKFLRGPGVQKRTARQGFCRALGAIGANWRRYLSVRTGHLRNTCRR
jgi:hypothetical protein